MIKEKTAYEMLETALGSGADFAEIFAERKKTTSVSALNGKARSANSGIDMGLGFRLIYGEKTVYAYTNDLSEKSLLALAKDISSASKEISTLKPIPFRVKEAEDIHNAVILPFDISKQDIFDRLRKANETALGYSKLISEAEASFSASEQEILIFNSEGLKKEDKRVRCRATLNSAASGSGEKQTGYIAPGALSGYEFFDSLDLEYLALKTAEQAAVMLSAGNAPSGRLPVVIGDGFGGVLFHEACGHGLEAISIAKNSSVFAGKLGEKIASDKVTAIDDGTIKNSWGSINIDDEGTKATKNILIEKGILKSYMVDNFYGKKLGLKPTGACRRQSYKLAPVPRMTNTYIAGGSDSPDDIISSIDLGLYCKSMGGGSVTPATAEFNFAVSEAYMIRNGKIAEPVRGATLIGRGDEIIKNIEMVAPNPKLACGMCGASSGSIPVCVGQPMLKVSEMTVGGKA
ncbi:MAG: TldD/PmbA family protein [Clostridiales bacterium]|nr:TldD/PmbA family protein [Clostridiales bacterium]